MFSFFSKNKKPDDFSDTASVLTLEPGEASACVPADASASLNRAIDEQILEEQLKRHKSMHVLIIGPRAAGKSTLLNGIRSACGEDDVKLGEEYIPTMGIAEAQLQHRGICFKIVEIGGRHAVPKNWIGVFDQTHTLLYVLDMSTYNLMVTNEATGEKESSLKCCQRQLNELVDNPDLNPATCITVILNKLDLFKEKIKDVPFSVCFEDYKGASTVEACCQFMNNSLKSLLFRKKNKKRQIYVLPMELRCPDSGKKTIDQFVGIIIIQTMTNTGVE